MTAMLISTVDSSSGTVAACHVFFVEGSLRAPIELQLTRWIETAIRRGVRRVRLDLSRLSTIDAAGVGELVTAFTAAKAAGGLLDISRASRRVRRTLEAAGVFTLLSGDCVTGPSNDQGKPADSTMPIERRIGL
jgi:anti-anti-sigma factor